MRLFVVVVLSSLFLISCDRKCGDCSQMPMLDSLQGAILVGAEGNFMWGNSSLGWYKPSTGIFHKDVYKTINQKNLGDVLQQIRRIGNSLFLVINNSGKLKWLNSQNLKEEGELSGLTSPRYIEPISNTQALISDLYANKIWVFNLVSQKLDGEISVNGWTEKMIFIPGINQVWALNKSRGKVMVISAFSLEVVDSFVTGEGNMDMVFDSKNNQIWVCGTGKGQEKGFIKCFGINRQLVKSFDFDAGTGPSALLLDKAVLYYLKKDVYQMEVASSALPLEPWFSAGSRNLYAMYKDENGFWLSDAKDYVQSSEILLLNDSAAIKNSFLAGINVSSFETMH